MFMPSQRLFYACIVCVAMCLCASTAYADDCAGLSLTVEASPATKAPFQLSITKDSRGARRLAFQPKDAKAATILTVFSSHSHVRALVPDHHRFFVMIDTSAGHRLDHRIVLMDASGHLKKTISLRDIMSEKDRAALARSVSHLRWFRSAKLSKTGNELVVETVRNVVTIDLYQSPGKVLSSTPSKTR